MTVAFKFSSRSLRNLDVHKDLQKVAHLALKLSPVDFIVVDGGRTIEEQRHYVRTGKSKTMKSRHLGGFAFDYVALDPQTKTPSYKIPLMRAVADACKEAGRQLNVPVEWGGDWKGFVDTPHIQLSKAKYP